jgi:large subunit ribosomal protein L22
MAELKSTGKSEKAMEKTKKIEEQKPTEMKEEKKIEEIKTDENKTEPKIEKEEKKEKPKKVPKNYALINGHSLPLSTKDGAHICDMIRYKKIDDAIQMIDNVIVKKQVVEMRNREVGHKHGKGIMGGRYPVDASKEFKVLLKNLKANAIYNELDLDKAVLIQCIVNKASRPYKRGGSRMKRSHITLKLGTNPRHKNIENKTKQTKENK